MTEPAARPAGSAPDASTGLGATRSVWLLARREVLARLWTPAVVIGTVGLAVLLAGYLVLQGVVFDRSAPIRVGFVGQAIGMESGLSAGAGQLDLTVRTSQVATVAEGTDAVRSGKLDVLVSGATDALTVTVADQLDNRLRAALDSLVRAQVLDAKLAEAGLHPSDVDTAIAQAGVRQVIQLDQSDPEHDQRLAVGLTAMLLLAAALGMFGTLAARGVVEDKSSGMAESLLATVRPGWLLAGRVIGFGVLGLLQLLVVGLIGLVVGVAAGVLAGVGNGVTALCFMLLWYALGFGLYGTALAVAAGLASRPGELFRAVAPVGGVLVAAVLISVTVLATTGSSILTVALSVLPPFAPLLLPARMAANALPGWQFAVAAGLMIVAIAWLARLAGRIYPAALLRDGDPVRLTKAVGQALGRA